MKIRRNRVLASIAVAVVALLISSILLFKSSPPSNSSRLLASGHKRPATTKIVHHGDHAPASGRGASDRSKSHFGSVTGTVAPGANDSAGLTEGFSPEPLPAGVTEVTSTMKVGQLLRSYETFKPSKAPSGKVPALVVLHGSGVPLWLEVERDGLLPLVASGKATLVYPDGYLRTWNAGVCCGAAAYAGVDDVGFITQVIDAVARNQLVSDVDLAGFSNGGRMAYRMVCTDPRLVKAFVVVDAVAAVDCAPGPAVSLLQIDGTQDGIVAYDSNDAPHVVGSFVEPTATQQVASWSRRDGCSGDITSRTMGDLNLIAWLDCTNGTAVQFATYEGLPHGWPQGGPGTPSAAAELWSFVNSPVSVPPPGTLTAPIQ
ncbi:MAG: alpha/beta hydrolase family esterase [Actinomycetota bacterium]